MRIRSLFFAVGLFATAVTPVWSGAARVSTSAAAVQPAPVVGPWLVFGVMFGTGSIIVNSVIVGQTQCRQLTLGEAVWSFVLPFVGIAFDQQMNKCKPHH